MAKNPLLVKAEIGQQKPTTMDLPKKEHTYGKKNTQDRYDAKILLSTWDTHKVNVTESKDRDFAKINRLIVKESDLKRAAELRHSLDVKLHRRHYSRPQYRSFKDLTTELTAYGMPTKPQTPLKTIINYEYAN